MDTKSDKPSHLKGFMWVVLACLLAVLLVCGISPLAHVIPWRWEVKLGNMLDTTSSQQTYIDDPQTEIIVQKIVNRIYPLNAKDHDFTIDVHIIRNAAVNAHAELGGKILINSGLIEQAQSPEEVAGVIAHEIGHVQHRDILKGAMMYFFSYAGIKMIFSGKYSYSAALSRYIFNMTFTRSEERDADEAALNRLQEAHVNNQGFRDFFIRMEKIDSSSSFLSDHPSNSARVQMAKRFTNQDDTPVLTAEEWKTLKEACTEKAENERADS